MHSMTGSWILLVKICEQTGTRATDTFYSLLVFFLSTPSPVCSRPTLASSSVLYTMHARILDDFAIWGAPTSAVQFPLRENIATAPIVLLEWQQHTIIYSCSQLTGDYLSYILEEVGSSTGRVEIGGRMVDIKEEVLAVREGDKVRVEVKVVVWPQW